MEMMKRFMLKYLIASVYGISGILVEHTSAFLILCTIGWILFEIYDKK